MLTQPMYTFVDVVRGYEITWDSLVENNPEIVKFLDTGLDSNFVSDLFGESDEDTKAVNTSWVKLAIVALVIAFGTEAAYRLLSDWGDIVLEAAICVIRKHNSPAQAHHDLSVCVSTEVAHTLITNTLGGTVDDCIEIVTRYVDLETDNPRLTKAVNHARSSTPIN